MKGWHRGYIGRFVLNYRFGFYRPGIEWRRWGIVRGSFGFVVFYLYRTSTRSRIT